jgi:hypothetical protein
MRHMRQIIDNFKKIHSLIGAPELMINIRRTLSKLIVKFILTDFGAHIEEYIYI